MQPRKNSPLALPFDEALCPSLFLCQIAAAAENQVRAQVAAHGNRALGLALASAKVVLDKGTVQVVFEGGIPAGARLMNAGGKALPALVNGKTGRLLKLGRVASTGRKAASFAASAALLIVEAAHMISGHDNAERLRKVERSVDRLVHAHESELKARLESIYRYSKELLHRGAGSLSEEDRRELHRQCRDLMELRARWRDDFRHQLGKVDRAEAGWVNKILFWRRDEAEQRCRERKAQEAESSLEIIQLMHFCLMLQMALASSSGRLESFQQLTLPDESRSWRALAELGRKRAGEIVGDAGKPEFAEFLAQLDGVADYWAPLERENRPLNALADSATQNHQVRSRRLRTARISIRRN